LQQKGLDVFCPLQKAKHQWSDRLKTVENPLLKTFVFARVKEEQRTDVRLIEGVVNFVYRNGKPVVMKDKVLQSIKLFQEAHPEVHVVEPLPINRENSDCVVRPAKSKHPKLRLETLNLVLVARPIQPRLTEARTDKI
jgi:transcription antitermination factor NusG